MCINNSIRMIFGRDNIFLREWQLVYSPQNPILDDLMSEVSRSLALTGIVGVGSSNQIFDVMLNQELIAGVEFQHPAVNISGTIYCL